MASIHAWLDKLPPISTDHEGLAGIPLDMSSRPTRRSPRKAAAPTPPRSSRENPSPDPCDDAPAAPRPASLATPPVLQPSSSATQAARSPSPSRSLSWASGISGASGRRSRSPVRRLGDLQLSDVRIQMKTLDAVRQNVPVDALDLYKAIRRIGTGRRVIPQAVKSLASAVLDACELDDLNFDDTADDRRAPAHEEQWRGVHEVLDAARECQECGLFEAAWNSEVHSRVLRLALQRGRNDTGVWYRDITAARISDKSVLPVSASGVAAQGKMVDYALILDTAWDKDLWRRVIATLRRRDELTINQTEAEHVRFSPIAVSIETKRDLVEGDAATLQLSVWVSAHFRRLQQLTDAGIPTMPLIIVQGHEWKLLLAEYSVEEGELVMYWMLNLGATHSILGTYQLIASLRQLTKWISETYRPWFEREVLAPASADDG